MGPYNVCIIKPNKAAFSETFIQEHINRLAGNKKVLCGGAFPVYDDKGDYLIKTTAGLISYLVQKRIFKKKNIGVRTRALVNYLKKEKIDIVFAEYGMVGAMVTQACKLANVPLVVHFHGADVHNRHTVLEYSKYYQEAFSYCDAFIAVSMDMIDALEKLGADRSKIHYVPCGVDINRFLPVKINTSDKNFLSVGRFVEKKSPDSVIRAFNKLLGTVPEARLWMVGDGPLRQEAESLLNKLNINDKVTMTGVLPSEEIYQLMKNMRCFVQHSVTAANGDMEGTPVTILEAGSVGLPIVSTRHAGIKQAVLDGKSGYLTDEHDIDAMAARMIQIAEAGSAELQEMGMAGREHIIHNYNISAQVKKIDDILISSINNRR